MQQSTTRKPFSEACERNREPIAVLLQQRLRECRAVLEIGSGTGQHAVHFAATMPWLNWQCSDRAEHLPGIEAWLEEAGLPNTLSPMELDVSHTPWPLPLSRTYDAAFSANTLHIMGWPEVEAFFAGLGDALTDTAMLVVYGPFNYNGAYTSDSNRAFDGWLKARDPRSGIRDFAAVDALARALGLRLIEDVAMPANNRCLIWQR
ncbi:MAG: DUF938 domain-containing protein [Lysobacterales bacterium]